MDTIPSTSRLRMLRVKSKLHMNAKEAHQTSDLAVYPDARRVNLEE